MRRAPYLAIVAAALVGLAAPAPLVAKEASEPSPGTASAEEAGKAAADASTAARPEGEAEAHGPMPKNAAAALVRATAAYEYGDMNQVVEAARPVAEGLLPATPTQQVQAFRLLGIGLYLTDRPTGAELAFTELLRKDPKARLDPTTTRPELVAFFENLRRQQLTQQRSERRIIWNFIPPVGQFQNEENTKGWIVLGVGVASLATAGTTAYLLHSWKQTGNTYGSHQSIAGQVRDANWIAVGVLAATYVYGVFDGLIGYSRPLEDGKPSVALKVFPEGGVGFAF